jgi:hypothetical protein
MEMGNCIAPERVSCQIRDKSTKQSRIWPDVSGLLETLAN